MKNLGKKNIAVEMKKAADKHGFEFEVVIGRVGYGVEKKIVTVGYRMRKGDVVLDFETRRRLLFGDVVMHGERMSIYSALKPNALRFGAIFNYFDEVLKKAKSEKRVRRAFEKSLRADIVDAQRDYIRATRRLDKFFKKANAKAGTP